MIKIYIGKKISDNNCITIQTRKGNNIKNTVYDKISTYMQYMNSEYERKYPKIKYRSKETSNYNCFGMVFASRRCFIIDNNITNILNDDDYKEVDINLVLPGDIVLYFDNHEIVHCGIVIERPNDKNFWNPLVISKWHCFREVIHHMNDCPYSPDTTERKFYRIFE